MPEEVMQEPRHIALLSKSDAISESEMMIIAGVCAEQLRVEVAPVWGMPTPRVKFFEHYGEVPDGWWPIIAWDRTDAPSAAGYHDLSAFGVPYASVFVRDALDRGSKMLKGRGSVSSIFSHEAIEAYVNPYLDRWALGPDGAQWAVEGADAVQADTYPLTELAVEVSSFVYPAYFRAGAPGPYDRLGKLTEPFSLDAGGYAIRKVDGQVQNIYGAEVPDWKRTKHASSRTERIGRAA